MALEDANSIDASSMPIPMVNTSTSRPAAANQSAAASCHIIQNDQQLPVIATASSAGMFNSTSASGSDRSVPYIDHTDPGCRQEAPADYNYFYTRISVPYIHTNHPVLASPTRSDCVSLSQANPSPTLAPVASDHYNHHQEQVSHHPLPQQQEQEQQSGSAPMSAVAAGTTATAFHQLPPPMSIHIQQPHPAVPQEPQPQAVDAATTSSFGALSFQNAHFQDYDPSGRLIKRQGKASKPKRTPRPPNAFILYRKAKQAEVIQQNPGVSNKEVSCIIGNMWKNEEPAVVAKFRKQAEIEKQLHKERHPNYKYQPRKPKSKRQAEAAAMAAAAAPAHHPQYVSAATVGGHPPHHSHSDVVDPTAATVGFYPYHRPSAAAYTANGGASMPQADITAAMYRRTPPPLHDLQVHTQQHIPPPLLSPPPSSTGLKTHGDANSGGQLWPSRHQQSLPPSSQTSGMMLYHPHHVPPAQLPPTPVNMTYPPPNSVGSSSSQGSTSSPTDYYYSQSIGGGSGPYSASGDFHHHHHHHHRQQQQQQ
ncbi:hypothetical protein EV182_001888, partial [Spiromyces aspiralis]